MNEIEYYTIKLRCKNCDSRDEYTIPFGRSLYEMSATAGSYYYHPTEKSGESFMGSALSKEVAVECSNCGLDSLVRDF